MNYRLIGIKQTASKIRLSFAYDNNTIDKYFNKVILALPFPVLRQVDGIFQLPLSPTKKQCIAELGMGKNTKVMLGFDKRFWRQTVENIPANTGCFVSDLGLAEYWDTSRKQSGKAGILTRYLGGRNADLPLDMVKETSLCDLDGIWAGQGSQHFDGNITLMSWQHMPYQLGSYSTMLTGQWTSLHGSAAEPEMNNSLIFAGEQASYHYFGLMNGAVEAGNRAAMRVLNLAMAA